MADDDIDDIDFEKAFREFAETAGPGADGEADLLEEFDEKDEWELPDDGAERILVIKLGALGDFIQAMGPFKAIRNHHPEARLVLLTTAPFESLALNCGYFDNVWIDTRPTLKDVGALWDLRRHLKKGRFRRVYDLQTSDRSSAYFRLFWPRKPAWSGIAKGCSHPHANPNRDNLHTITRQAQQLAFAGIPKTPPPDLSWMKGDVDRLDIPFPFVLLVPGGSPHRREKRWPAKAYGELCKRLLARGLTPVLLGSMEEESIMAEILEVCPLAHNLAGMTTLEDIGELARLARGAVGNDTGPMHIIAAIGCQCVVLFSSASDPALCAPLGRRVKTFRKVSLMNVYVDEVENALRSRGAFVKPEPS